MDFNLLCTVLRGVLREVARSVEVVVGLDGVRSVDLDRRVNEFWVGFEWIGGGWLTICVAALSKNGGRWWVDLDRRVSWVGGGNSSWWYRHCITIISPLYHYIYNVHITYDRCQSLGVPADHISLYYLNIVVLTLDIVSL